MKIAVLALVMMISAVTFGQEVIPADAVKWALKHVDGWTSCSKYDGFADC